MDDERCRFVFNIHGDAGAGKTFLTRAAVTVGLAARDVSLA
ncbi:MAG TPA: hypothetical protein VMU95_04980 [Trebonia sp.]|nr:hypothetical protein [Trebonia sp.]